MAYPNNNNNGNPYIFQPPPPPPPKAIGPQQPFTGGYSRGNFGNNNSRGRGNRGGNRGSFGSRGGGSGNQGRGGFGGYNAPPHQHPQSYPVAGYSTPAPPLPQQSYNSRPGPPQSVHPSVPSPSFQQSYNNRPGSQQFPHQPPSQTYSQPSFPPPHQQPHPSYPQLQQPHQAYPQNHGYKPPQASTFTPPPPPPQWQQQHTSSTSPPSGQPLRFFPQQPPPVTSYPSQPPPPPPPPPTNYQHSPSFTPNHRQNNNNQSHSFSNHSARPQRSYADLKVDGRVRPPAPPSVPTFFPSSLPPRPPSLPQQPPPPASFNAHPPNQHSHSNNRGRGRGFGHGSHSGFNQDRRHKDRGQKNHNNQESGYDISPEELAVWKASGGKIKGTNLTLQDPEEIDEWIKARKNKFPTAAKRAEKEKEEEDKRKTEQAEVLQRKMNSLNEAEANLKKRKLDEVDGAEPSKKPSKKKKRKKRKKNPQADAPVVFAKPADDAKTVEPVEGAGNEAEQVEEQQEQVPADEEMVVVVDDEQEEPATDLLNIDSFEAEVLENMMDDTITVDMDTPEANVEGLIASEIVEEDELNFDDIIHDGFSSVADYMPKTPDEPVDFNENTVGNDGTVENVIGDEVVLDQNAESITMSTSSDAESAVESAEGDDADGTSSSGSESDAESDEDEDAPPEEVSSSKQANSEPEKTSTNPAKKKQVCKMYLRKNCRFGAKCRFLHEGTPMSDKEKREAKKQQNEQTKNSVDAEPMKLTLYDRLMRTQMEKENVILLQAISYLAENGVLKP